MLAKVPSDTKCLIQFENNPQKIYFSGQTICVKVRLTLEKVKVVREMYILVNGNGLSTWSSDSTHSRTHDFINEKLYVLGGSYGEQTVQPGIYKHAFDCNLPLSSPSSVESLYAQIRYSAALIIQYTTSQETFREYFTVIKELDLALIPSAHQPNMVGSSEQFIFCWSLCLVKSEPLKIIINIPFSGYIPGDTIQLQIAVNNNSNQDVESFVIQINKIVSVKTNIENQTGPTHREDIAIKLINKSCLANENLVLNESITVPITSPTDSSNSLCTVSYSLDVTAVTDTCCHFNVDASVPIIIGTKPISVLAQSTFNPYSAYKLFNGGYEHIPSASGSRIPSPALSTQKLQALTAVPPTYEESVITEQISKISNFSNIGFSISS